MGKTMALTFSVHARHRFFYVTVAALMIFGFGRAAQAQEKFTFQTNWLAQGEHGGYYQALATGLYKKAGLDVTIKQGGANTNLMQMLAAGQFDCLMSTSDAQVLRAQEQGIAVMMVASAFQKDPQGIAAHPDVKTIQDLKTRTLLISAGAYNHFWPWLKAKFGFEDSQTKPYSYSLQPFIVNSNVAIQAYLTYDPYVIESQTNIKPSFFLFSDYGWTNYSSSIACMEKTIKERPQAVAAFVKASMQGFKDYLTGDPTAANDFIKKENPNQTDGQIAFARSVMKSRGLVMGGDAATMGIGIITDDRMKETFDMLAGLKLVNPAKVDLKRAYTTQFVKDLKIIP